MKATEILAWIILAVIFLPIIVMGATCSSCMSYVSDYVEHERTLKEERREGAKPTPVDWQWKPRREGALREY